MSLKNLPFFQTGDYRVYLKNISVTDNGWNSKQELIEEWYITTYTVAPEPVPGQPAISDLAHKRFLDPTNRAALEYAGIVPKFAGTAGSSGYSYYNWRESWTGVGFTAIASWAYLKLYNDAYSDFVLLSSDIQTVGGGDIIVRNRWGGYIKGLVSNTTDPTSTNIASTKRIEQAIVEYSTGRRESVIWRRDWTTDPAAGSDKTGTDIGGNPVRKYSFDGRPQDVTQTRIRVRIVKNAQKVAKSDVANTLAAFVGKRNDDVFLGYAANWLWCDSFQMVDLEGPFYELVFDFIYDEWYEHSQEPELDPDGKPTLDATGANYADVQWVRMTRDGANFNKIFFETSANLTAGTIWTDQQTLASKGWVTR